MSTIKVDTIQNTSGVEQFTAKAWVTYNMSTVSINASGNVSSLTDLGTGSPQFNMSNAIAAANGLAWNSPAIYSSGNEYPVQSGAYVTSTSVWKAYCGSDSTSRTDWQLGYSGIIR